METQEVMARIRAMRDAGLGMQVIANKVGVTWRTIRRWELGETTPDSKPAINALRLASKGYYDG